MFGPVELGLLVAIVLLFVGASRLPKLGKALGRTRKAAKVGRAEIERELEDD
ncbi:Sec-independent protein translocase subunit TatA/TatB [Halarchaeum sp. P4]|uniref:Sec-independent protein translocase subunit TatA/TatB n=1 Tax=Halarchaeum sp. P4 TaxID=3421639 RepID=UPI003EB77B61